jgi:predicted DNA binding CopG/RHH family protein
MANSEALKRARANYEAKFKKPTIRLKVEEMDRVNAIARSQGMNSTQWLQKIILEALNKEE